MSWQAQLKGDSLSWLLEPDPPGVRYLALRDLLDRPGDDPELLAARDEAHARGPIATILAAMEPGAYWVQPGAGYYPKYRGTVWSLITLAQLGASPEADPRVAQAVETMLEQSLLPGGQFGIGGTPSSTADCLQGNLCYALLALGCDSQRLDPAFEWMARTTTGEGLAPNTDRNAPLRYYASKCGPLFACGSNNKLPCAWGAAKVMLAFAKLPAKKRTPLIERTIQQGIEFLFSVDPATAGYPNGWTPKPSRNWWLFGFPVFYITDLLQIVEALVLLGCGNDTRLKNALELIRNKQDTEGRWALEYDYAGKIWFDAGEKKKPNKWVSLRALRVLDAVS